MTTMELYKKILTDRTNHYRALWEKHSIMQDLCMSEAYKKALLLLDYAEKDDYESLAQFDFYEKDNE